MEVSLEVATPASGGRQLCVEAGRPRSRGGSKRREHGPRLTKGDGDRQTDRQKGGGREWEFCAIAVSALMAEAFL